MAVLISVGWASPTILFPIAELFWWATLSVVGNAYPTVYPIITDVKDQL